MSPDLELFISMLLYISILVLVIVLIVLGIKLIRTLARIDKVIDDVEVKMNKVDGVFNLIDKTTDIAASISDKVIGSLSKGLKMLFKKKKGSDTDGEE